MTADTDELCPVVVKVGPETVVDEDATVLDRVASVGSVGSSHMSSEAAISTTFNFDHRLCFLTDLTEWLLSPIWVVMESRAMGDSQRA